MELFRSMRNQNRIYLLLCLGLFVRLIAIPFSATNEADAVSRIFRGWRLLSEPELITHGVWGPLHFYLISGAMLICENPVFSPMLLNILFSVTTVVPLYLFIRQEWEELSALYVSAAYILYPPAIYNSLMAVSEVPFVFFVSLSLLTISMARKNNGNWKNALTAGLCLTLAGALRYEAWVLIPLMGLLLWNRKKLLSVFLIASILFPCYWMLGNYLYYNDALYSVNAATYWQVNISEINKNLSIDKIIDRITFYPKTIFWGLTPLVSSACLLGMVFSLIKKNRQCVWLIPLVGLLIVFMYKSLNGSLLLRTRYSLILGLFTLPFAAETINCFSAYHRRKLIAFILIATMIPLSYVRFVLPWKIASHIPNPIQAIPNVSPRARALSAELTNQMRNRNEGLILDFFGWEETFFVALMTKKNPKDILIMPGVRTQKVKTTKLKKLLNIRKTGLLLRKSNSDFLHIEKTNQGKFLLKFDGLQKQLILKKLSHVGGVSFFRYRVLK